jgi:surface antigen
MIHRTLWRGTLVLAASLFGCAEAVDEVETEATALALVTDGPCRESVPANRYIDGIPAYAQCADSAAGAIYSNNGVDTSTTKLGPDWVRTQWSGGYQCTELAHRYLLFRWKVTWLPNGNAGEWCNRQPPASSGVVQTDTPVHGDLMVLAGGSCGAGTATGHVNVVDVVDDSRARVTVVEQNMARRGTYAISCAKCFLHVVANDGTVDAED